MTKKRGGSDFQKAYELDPRSALSAAAQGLAARPPGERSDRALTRLQASRHKKQNDALLLYLMAESEARKAQNRARRSCETASARQPKPGLSLQPTLGADRGSCETTIASGRNQEAVETVVERPRKRSEAIRRSCTTSSRGCEKNGKQDEIPAVLQG